MDPLGVWGGYSWNAFLMWGRQGELSSRIRVVTHPGIKYSSTHHSDLAQPPGPLIIIIQLLQWMLSFSPRSTGDPHIML